MHGSVDIWTIRLQNLLVNSLSPDEQERAARFRFDEDRRNWIAARSSLRLILGRCLQRPPESLRFLLGAHGKPALADSDLHFNLSHSRGWAMVAVSPVAPVGVDLEAIRDGVDMARLLRRIDERELPTERVELFQRWALREARTKTTGQPLMTPPAADVFAISLTAPEGYVAAVAMQGIVPKPVYCGGL